jgi:medium-chain acyl-[acyl-carrier-protein] hydrolase
MTNAAELRRWVYSNGGRSKRSADFRLFCFPYAGAGASVFRDWHKEVPSVADVVPVQLPGREGRWSEQPVQDLPLLAATVATALEPLLIEPYAFFGHSMGALIAFELARVIRRRGLPLPVHLFVSATRAPHVPDREPSVHHLPDVLLWKTVMRDYGAPQAGAALNPEMAAIVLPILRADFRMCESYKPSWEDPLPFPLTAYGGRHDLRVTYADLSAWSSYTTGPFRMRLFPGGHFFLSRDSAVFFKAFADDLAGLSAFKKTVRCAVE